MKLYRFLTVLLLYAMAAIAYADSWGLIDQTEFFSENRKHVLKIEPHPEPSNKPGHCRATLFKGKNEVWSRNLINNHAPVHVFVADSGDYVLTMDEWHSVGELPIVIYGHWGRLIRVHSIDSLALGSDKKHIKRSVSSYWWNEDSVSFFGPNEEKFFIRLHWGKWIVLDLHNGDLFQQKETFFRDDLRIEHEKEWQTLVKFRQRTLAQKAIRMLGSKEPAERKTGALLCGQEKLTDAIPALHHLLEDKATYRTNATRVYYVRKAALEALEAMGKVVEGVITQELDNR